MVYTLSGEGMKCNIGDLLHSNYIGRLYTVTDIYKSDINGDTMYEVQYYCNHYKQYIKSRMLQYLIEDMDFTHYAVVK